MVNSDESKDDINRAYGLISSGNVRNEMITSDVRECITAGHTPVILTKYKEHAKHLYDELQGSVDHVFILYGEILIKKMLKSECL